MNYNSVILVGVLVISGLWWLVHATHHYPGPRVMQLYIYEDALPTSSVGDRASLKPVETINNPRPLA